MMVMELIVDMSAFLKTNLVDGLKLAVILTEKPQETF